MGEARRNEGEYDSRAGCGWPGPSPNPRCRDQVSVHPSQHAWRPGPATQPAPRAPSPCGCRRRGGCSRGAACSRRQLGRPPRGAVRPPVLLRSKDELPVGVVPGGSVPPGWKGGRQVGCIPHDPATEPAPWAAGGGEEEARVSARARAPGRGRLFGGNVCPFRAGSAAGPTRPLLGASGVRV